MGKPPRKSAPCRMCLRLFIKPRPEQEYCSKTCGYRARSQRAKEDKALNGKRCCKCHEIKPLSEFTRNAAAYDGLKQICKPCARLERIDRLARVMKDPDRKRLHQLTSMRARASKEAKTTNATKDEWLTHLRSPRLKGLRNRIAEAIRQRERYASDKGYQQRMLERQRRRHLERPWVMLARKHRRDARLNGNHDDGTVTAESLRALWVTTASCLYCGLELNCWNRSIDHMHPLSKGGVHGLTNIVVVCGSCNELKRNKWFDEWLELLADPFRSQAHDRFVFNKDSGSS